MNDTACNFARAFMDRFKLTDDIKATIPAETEMLHMGQILRQAAIDPDTNDHDVLIGLAADYLRRNERMPGWLAEFAADVLEGKRKRPTKRGSDKYTNFERDYKFFRAVQEVAHQFDLPAYSNNELSKKTTAAEIVSQATGYSNDVVIAAYKKYTR